MYVHKIKHTKLNLSFERTLEQTLFSKRVVSQNKSESGHPLTTNTGVN